MTYDEINRRNEEYHAYCEELATQYRRDESMIEAAIEEKIEEIAKAFVNNQDNPEELGRAIIKEINDILFRYAEMDL